jgi:hypothetical protein
LDVLSDWPKAQLGSSSKRLGKFNHTLTCREGGMYHYGEDIQAGHSRVTGWWLAFDARPRRKCWLADRLATYRYLSTAYVARWDALVMPGSRNLSTPLRAELAPYSGNGRLGGVDNVPQLLNCYQPVGRPLSTTSTSVSPVSYESCI